VSDCYATPLSAARTYTAAVISVIPVKADGSKAPLLKDWRQYSERLPTDEELTQWFDRPNPPGIGIVPGPASGNLVVLDFEKRGGEAAYTEFMLKVKDTPLFGIIYSSPVVRTPSGGRHVWVRLPEPTAGGVLARYRGTSPKTAKVKAEIRGAGHQCLAPGCPASCHKSGELYTFESKGWLPC